MYNLLSVTITVLAFGFTSFTGISALFRFQSRKTRYFILLQASVLVYLLGHLLEQLSQNAGEAYTAVKVLRLGAGILEVSLVLFIADYCDVRLSPVFVKTPLLVLSAATVLSMWTNQYHHLFYQDYWLNGSPRYLDFHPGAAYYLAAGFMVLCVAGTVFIVAITLKRRKNRYRSQLFIMLVYLCLPFIAEAAYYIINFAGLGQFYITPFAIALMNILMYRGLVRYNIFELIPLATTAIIQNINEGFVLVDAEDNYLSCNQSAEAFLPGIRGFPRGEKVFSIPCWPAELAAPMPESAEFSVIPGVESAKTPEEILSEGGEVRYFQASVSPVVQSGILNAKVILVRDISDTKKLMRELENAAYTDSLTGLYNRRHFYELAAMTVERARRTHERLYAVMLDLDHFKNVNDEYGHAVGDVTLKTIAGIIRQTMRLYDLVGRYGGEEFIMLLSGNDGIELMRLLERVRTTVAAAPIQTGSQTITITCSIGYALLKESESLDDAINQADAAMYQAKMAGRNRVVYHNDQ